MTAVEEHLSTAGETPGDSAHCDSVIHCSCWLMLLLLSITISEVTIATVILHAQVVIAIMDLLH